MYFMITFIKRKDTTIDSPFEAVDIEGSLATLVLSHESLMERIVNKNLPSDIVDMCEISKEEYDKANYHLVW